MLRIGRQRFWVAKEDAISSYESIIRDFRQNQKLIQGTAIEHVMGMKPVDNYRLMVQFKTTLNRLTLASVLKEINVSRVMQHPFLRNIHKLGVVGAGQGITWQTRPSGARCHMPRRMWRPHGMPSEHHGARIYWV